MLKQGPMEAYIAIDMLVDPFETNRVPLAGPQPPTDLFRGPLFLQQAVDAMPQVGRNAVADFGASPMQGEKVDLLRAIPQPSQIPSHFTAIGGSVDSNHGGDLLIRMGHLRFSLHIERSTTILERCGR